MFEERWCNDEEEKDAEEYAAELLKHELGEKELGKTVDVRGRPKWTHHIWAEKALELATKAEIASTNHSILTVKSNLPAPLRRRLEARYRDWTSFVKAIKNVNSDATIAKEVEERAKQEAEKAESAAKLARAEAEIALMKKKIEERERMSAMVGQFNRTNLTSTPRSMPYQPRQYGVTGGALDFRRPGQISTQRFPSTQSQLSPADLATLRRNTNAIPTPANTPDGQNEYQRQVAEWERQHGPNAFVTIHTPYPLRPGTLPVGSNECWNCGTSGHRGDECEVLSRPELMNIRERDWRRLCARYLPRRTPVRYVYI